MNKSLRLHRETVRMALSSIGAHRLRSALTIAGITIGIFSVIGVMTAVSALRGSIESGLTFLGANTFQFAKNPIAQIGGNGWWKYQHRRNITLAQAERYQELMRDVAPIVCLKIANHGAQVTYANHNSTPSYDYFGTNEYFVRSNQYDIATGRNLTDGDVALSSAVAVVGHGVVSKLFPSQDPLGRTIKVSGHPYTIVGTFVEKGTSLGADQDSIVIVPITRFVIDNGKNNQSVNIATEAPSPTEYDATMDRGVTAMRIARQLGPGRENDFEIYSNDSLLSAFGKVADAVRAGAFVISAIALVAAGVGIMNIMLVSVTERTKEIGVRKSLGARKKTILTQFLTESVAISLAGGVAGIVLGVLAGNALALLLKASIVFPWGWALAGLVVCTAIGVGFGFYPALRAASLDPIEALRYE